MVADGVPWCVCIKAGGRHGSYGPGGDFGGSDGVYDRRGVSDGMGVVAGSVSVDAAGRGSAGAATVGIGSRHAGCGAGLREKLTVDSSQSREKRPKTEVRNAKRERGERRWWH